MGLLSNDTPVFVKSTTSAEIQLQQMRDLQGRVAECDRWRLERDIRITEAGIKGESEVAYELRNSHLPIFVLQDLYLECGDLSGQIDFLVIAPHVNIVIECKNLLGNIEVDNRGEFIRTFGKGKYRTRESIYSPITQNERHLQLMREIRMSEVSAVRAAAIKHYFDDRNKSVIVLANDKTVLSDRFAKREVKQQIIRADALISFIRDTDAACKSNDKSSRSEQQKSAEKWLAHHVERPVDVSGKYQLVGDAGEAAANTAGAAVDAVEGDVPACPKCGKPMVKRTAKRGDRAGKPFWGCPDYPHCRGIVNIAEG